MNEFCFVQALALLGDRFMRLPHQSPRVPGRLAP
jgi:hypothetical protein